MSQPASKPAKKTAPSDRYTALLLISLLALIVGCVLLYLEVASHGPNPTAAFRGGNEILAFQDKLPTICNGFFDSSF